MVGALVAGGRDEVERLFVVVTGEKSERFGFDKKKRENEWE